MANIKYNEFSDGKYFFSDKDIRSALSLARGKFLSELTFTEDKSLLPPLELNDASQATLNGYMIDLQSLPLSLLGEGVASGRLTLRSESDAVQEAFNGLISGGVPRPSSFFKK